MKRFPSLVEDKIIHVFLNKPQQKTKQLNEISSIWGLGENRAHFKPFIYHLHAMQKRGSKSKRGMQPTLYSIWASKEDMISSLTLTIKTKLQVDMGGYAHEEPTCRVTSLDKKAKGRCLSY